MTGLKKTLSLIVLMFLVLVFAGCAKKQSDGTKLRLAFWGDVKEIEIIKNSVARFNEANPGIEVALERLPAGDPYTEKILTQMAGGNPVDVMFVNAEQFYIYAEKGILKPLNEHIKKDNFPIEGFYKEVVDKFSLNGNIYVIPRDIAPVCVVYYNKDMFDKAGLEYPTSDWTWDDLLTKAKRFVKTDKDGTKTFGFADDWPLWDNFVYSNGGTLVDDYKNPKKCLIDSKEALEAIKYRQDLIYKHKVMPSPSNMSAMGGVGASDLFLNGKTAMFLSGIWKTPFFRDIRGFKWDAVMFPKGPTGKRGFMMSGGGYAVVNKTKNPDAAWKLVTYLSGDEGQIELARTGLAQPAKKEIAASKEFLDGKAPAGKKFLLDSVQYGRFVPGSSRWQEAMSAYLYPALDKVWAGQAEPKDVVPGAVKEINKLLK